MRIRQWLVAGLFVFTASSSEAVVITLGEQDFLDGVSLGTSAYSSAQAGEPVPFNAPNGNDSASDFSATWTFDFAPSAVGSALLSLGLWEHDSAVPGSQVSSFFVDGHDLTALLDAQLESFGGRQQEGPITASEYNIYTVMLPSTTFLDLADGMATFSLSLTAGGNSGFDIGPTVGNFAGIDFSTLSIETTSAVPEPTTVGFFGILAGFLALERRRRRLSR